MRAAEPKHLAGPARIPVLPTPVAHALRALPLAALHWPLDRLVSAIARRHPGLFARLGTHAEMRFLIDPVDLPVAFRLRPRPERPRVEVARRPVPAASWDARIAGPLAALLGMVHGRFDGDALFFSRDLSIEGDTEAILALRNAIDDAELDLAVEAAAVFGPLAPLVERPARVVLPIAERLTGVALSRSAGRAT
jgi:predicted lipid carrier protein YhbT